VAPCCLHGQVWARCMMQVACCAAQRLALSARPWMCEGVLRVGCRISRQQTAAACAAELHTCVTESEPKHLWKLSMQDADSMWICRHPCPACGHVSDLPQTCLIKCSLQRLPPFPLSLYITTHTSETTDLLHLPPHVLVHQTPALRPPRELARQNTSYSAAARVGRHLPWKGATQLCSHSQSCATAYAELVFACVESQAGTQLRSRLVRPLQAYGARAHGLRLQWKPRGGGWRADSSKRALLPRQRACSHCMQTCRRCRLRGLAKCS